MDTKSTESQTRWYAVKVLFESVHSGDPLPDKLDLDDDDNNLKLFEERIILVKALNEGQANEKAEINAKNSEDEYLNTYGVSILVQFVKILHTFELNDDELTDGTEIYARFIHASNENTAMDIIKRYYPEAAHIE
ncbi:DUF4288 domain-containing protein [Brevibacillus sp. BC25]|uniref:DUF4288 domain-containing protein n=1 Tax=Brevibacillus sp. BC25 TaxID=1144308 RepID=UPI00027146A8|nr:DUF4288 domain-containing protein [Brevibacillus sp. BC25]EJL31957.1 hypothetical protein PMI05_00474 [Brevibacillus sp. BC25]